MGTRSSFPPDTTQKCYRLFGVTLASDYPFATPLPQITGIPDVSFTCIGEKPPIAEGVKKLMHASKSTSDNGESLFSIHSMNDWHVFHYGNMVDFYLSSDKIVAHLLDPAHAYMIEMMLLGEIFSLWLELKGIPTIHSSAAVVDNDAIAFISSSKGGKSSLAAAFARKGHRILTDDVLPVEDRNGHFLGRPGYPAMRMWPDQAGHFIGDYEKFDLVHPEFSKRRIPLGSGGFGAFCLEEKPLKVMYIPQRHSLGCDITIEPLSKKNAFFALIQNSFTVGLIELLGLQQQRMNFFSRMVMQVPVRRLNYPDGFQHLPFVVDAVLEDSALL